MSINSFPFNFITFRPTNLRTLLSFVMEVCLNVEVKNEEEKELACKDNVFSDFYRVSQEHVVVKVPHVSGIVVDFTPPIYASTMGFLVKIVVIYKFLAPRRE